MEISLIYLLILAEVMFVLLGLSITFFILWFRKPKPIEVTSEQPIENAESELDEIDLGSSYVDYLDLAIERNNNKLQEAENNTESADESAESLLPTEKQAELLQVREFFLRIEKEAAEQTEHEINFWQHIYSGMQDLIEKHKTSDSHTQTVSTTNTVVSHKTETKEKVIYVETQGKKIDSEVNKLKDIIYEQENALSSMMKALESAETDMPEESEPLKAIRQQIQNMERQLSDSKMCMEVLEMENDRLQEEVNRLSEKHSELFEDSTENSKPTESKSMIDLDQMKEVMAEQQAKIDQLLTTIDSLEIEASQAEKLKETLSSFTRTSKEMMSCIAILEEENERLQEVASHVHDDDKDDTQTAPANNNADESELQGKISELEEELIKKDVAFAQLQDEFSSMETEYLAMYEAMHNSG